MPKKRPRRDRTIQIQTLNAIQRGKKNSNLFADFMTRMSFLWKVQEFQGSTGGEQEKKGGRAKGLGGKGGEG